MPPESLLLKVLLVKVDTAIGFFSRTVWFGTARPHNHNTSVKTPAASPKGPAGSVQQALYRGEKSSGSE
ncbi:hypothetical protein DRJ27_05695 [Candidatus Acetothermia bacterium]|nr:MAG: hypothetical protein DRJ27_05695 [Candidatus Acetothermia bacterium]